MKIAVVKYNAGNVRSVIFALNRLGLDPIWTDDPEVLRSSDGVIFPGVGEAKSAMEYLHERLLDNVIKGLSCPVLGICLGLQLMCAHSEENDTPCFGIFDEQVTRFETGLKVPHMGWNALLNMKGPLFRDIKDGSHVYFVHSYHAEISSDTIAETEYDELFSSALHRDNFFGVQFHPEKSGETGEKILSNFLECCGHV